MNFKGKVSFLGTGSGWRHLTNQEIDLRLTRAREAGIPINSKTLPSTLHVANHTSLLFELPRGNLLVDAGPTFNDSWNMLRGLRILKGEPGHGPIKSLFITHGHFDHKDGLEPLFCISPTEQYRDKSGRGKEYFDLISIFGADNIFAMIKNEYAWRAEQCAAIFKPITETGEAFDLLGTTMKVFQLEHGINYYSWGLRIGGLSYIPDFNNVPNASFDVIKGSKLIIMECNSVDEQSASHVNLAEAIDWGEQFHRFGMTKLVLTHLGADTFPHTREERVRLFNSYDLPFRLDPAEDYMELPFTCANDA